MGTEEFWVPAALSLLSAGTQYANQSNANARANSAQVQNIEEQEANQQKANSQVSALTQQITKNSPQTLADELTGNYVSNLRKNAAGAPTGSGTTGSPINFGATTSALPPNVGGSSRYNSDVANTQSQVQSYGNQEAKLMGDIAAPTRLRQNEGLGMDTLGTSLNLLGAKSYTENFVNQLRSQAAGQQNPWLTLLAGGLQGAAGTMSKNAGGAPGTMAPGTVLGNGTVNGWSPTAPNAGNISGFNTNYWDTSP
jgi:hypothetical protein